MFIPIITTIASAIPTALLVIISSFIFVFLCVWILEKEAGHEADPEY